MPDLLIDTNPQGSPAWLAARAGCVTGSRAADVVAVRKDGQPTAARADYLAQLVAEHLTGQPQETGIVTPWMQRGTELEPEARLRLEAHIDEPIFEAGFIRRALGWQDHAYHIGCSVDGYFGGSPQHGIVELKCPKPTTHLRYLREGVIPSDYWPQILHNLLVTRAEVCWFASYCPILPTPLQLFALKVERGDPDVEKRRTTYQLALSAFLSDLDTELDYWRTRA